MGKRLQDCHRPGVLVFLPPTLASNLNTSSGYVAGVEDPYEREMTIQKSPRSSFPKGTVKIAEKLFGSRFERNCARMLADEIG